MEKKFNNLHALLETDDEACRYFDSLPKYVQEAINSRPEGVNSFESLCHYADNLTRGDY